MHIEDFAPCTPWDDNTGTIRAVGWLEREHDYSRGDVPREVMRALVPLLVDPWQPAVCAGVHRCSFCRFTGGPGTLRFESTTVAIGSSTLFVPGDGLVYAAPSLLVHYIDAHEYAPPTEFQQAVLNCPPMRSMAYLRAIRERAPRLVALTKHSDKP